MAGDGTLKPLFSWRSAILDSSLSPTTKLVALALATYMSDRGDSAHPGPARLAKDTSLHLSTVKERLVELERAGWLRCTMRGGRKGERRCANEYAACLPEPVATGDPSPTAPGAQDDPSPSPSAPVAHGDPNSPETSPRRTSTRDQPFEDDFDDWYSGYPRKIDRKRAAAMYRARRREGVTAEQLTAARDHYAALASDDPRFVKYPATFLAKDGPWTEWEHGPPAGANPTPGRGKLGALDAVRSRR